jgi:hypothetical protein
VTSSARAPAEGTDVQARSRLTAGAAAWERWYSGSDWLFFWATRTTPRTDPPPRHLRRFPADLSVPVGNRGPKNQRAPPLGPSTIGRHVFPGRGRAT